MYKRRPESYGCSWEYSIRNRFFTRKVRHGDCSTDSELLVSFSESGNENLTFIKARKFLFRSREGNSCMHKSTPMRIKNITIQPDTQADPLCGVVFHLLYDHHIRLVSFQ